MYTKVIQSGDLIEEWTFERSPAPKKNPKPRVKRVFKQERRLDNVKRAANTFRRLVRANLAKYGPPALMTLTTAENEDIEAGYKHFTAFGKQLRKNFGNGLVWIGVPEFQKRGAVHFHVLIWGLPPKIPCVLSREFYTDKTGKKHRKHVCLKESGCERNTRTLAPLWGRGFLDICTTDGNTRLSSYLAKYMSKAMHDKRLVAKRAYSATRNVVRPSHFNTAFQIRMAYEAVGLTVDNSPMKTREYDTLFLGRCVYKSYQLDQS